MGHSLASFVGPLFELQSPSVSFGIEVLGPEARLIGEHHGVIGALQAILGVFSALVIGAERRFVEALILITCWLPLRRVTE